MTFPCESPLAHPAAQTARHIRASLGVKGEMEPIPPGPLLSIHMQSNRPEAFVRFLDRLEASLDDPSRIEVIIKIDDTDAVMNALLPVEAARRPFALKYISTPLPGGFFGLWRSMNDMLLICDPDAYFITNTNDEMEYLNKGWDTALAQYVGLFPDHIFRLRASRSRVRNFYDVWECGFAPDSFAIYTKKWMDICGDWTPCNGPDSFNECVAWYFGWHDRFNQFRRIRSIPIYDLLLSSEAVSVGLESNYEALRCRVCGAAKAWAILMSHPMQNEASRRSQKLVAHIRAAEEQWRDPVFTDNGASIVVTAADGATQHFPYRLSRIAVTLRNVRRNFAFYYYNGGGQTQRGRWLRQWAGYALLRCGCLESLHIRLRRWRLARKHDTSL